jgi:molecular chaperone DnaK
VSPDVEVSAEGTFVVQVSLVRHKQNRFTLSALGADGHPVALRGADLAIVHGISVADPPLSRTVGVARSDNTVHSYFQKGTPLPARRSFAHRTIAAVTAGTAQDVLAIPIVQGEYIRAHRNRLVGTLQIEGRVLKRDLPAGAAIEVTLQLDRSGRLQARADVPLAGQSFENVAHLLVPTASLEVLGLELRETENRTAKVRLRTFQAGLSEEVMRLDGATRLLAEARTGLAAAEGGDRDAAQRVHRLLLEINALMDSVEDGLRWPEIEAEAEGAIQAGLSWVSSWGTPTEKSLFEEALKAAGEARQARDTAALERQLKVMSGLRHAAFARDPRADTLVFNWYASKISEATDLPRAKALVAQGREALKKNDSGSLRGINVQLQELFPGSTEEQARSFGSGIL